MTFTELRGTSQQHGICQLCDGIRPAMTLFGALVVACDCVPVHMGAIQLPRPNVAVHIDRDPGDES